MALARAFCSTVDISHLLNCQHASNERMENILSNQHPTVNGTRDAIEYLTLKITTTNLLATQFMYIPVVQNYTSKNHLRCNKFV